jgi:NAD-dependent deacetylase
MATYSMFTKQPREVWGWYLHRIRVYAAAEPNAAHVALAQLERTLTHRFALITQNVDGLHLAAGNTPARTFQIHGNLNHMRCDEACNGALYDVPPASAFSGTADSADTLSPELWGRLHCPRCGALCRPHVLWFDEYYDEELYRAQSALSAALGGQVIVIVGTTGATSLPYQIGQLAAQKGIPIINVNPEEQHFARLAEAHNGAWLRGTACEWVPFLADRIATEMT